jgi:hypothetical protein
MKILLALLLSAASALAITTNVVFTWDSQMGPGIGFKFYEIVGTQRIFLGGATTNRFTVQNWNVGAPRIFTVTSTNFWGESGEATPYISPPAPVTPQNLAPAGFAFITPVPGTLELSRDLIDWRERLRITAAGSGSASIELVQIPLEPMMFGRVKPPTSLNRTVLPIPTKP